MAKDKLTFMKTWYDSVKGDKFNATTDQEMAYVLFAAYQYAVTGTPIDLGDVFGPEFRGLNRCMPNIYDQMDRIDNWGRENSGKNQKYDPDAIYRLAKLGRTQKEICEELGYDVSKYRSISSNKGWLRAKAEEGTEIFGKGTEKYRNLQKCTEIGQKSTESVQKCTEIVQKFDF